MEVTEGIVIVGAGLAGLATALGLHRQGLRSLVLESSDTLRASGFFITLLTNAWRSLDALGVGDLPRGLHVRLEELIFSSAISGSITWRSELMSQGECGEHEVRCVRRNILLEALAKELPDGIIRYSSKVVSIEEIGNLKLLHLQDGSTLKAKILIGCDGINSVVAKWLGLQKPTHSGRYALRGLTIHPEGHGLKPEFAFYFGKGYRSGMFPSDQKSIYWFYTWTSAANEEEVSKVGMKVREFLLSKMKTAKVPEEYRQAMEKSELGSVASSPLRYRSPFNLLWGDISKGNVCVAGDAFHPMTPDIAQGGCAALEDGVILAKCLGEAVLNGGEGGKDEQCRIEAALKRYASKRRWRSFMLSATACVLGFVQESDLPVLNFLRDKCFAGFMAKMMLSLADFDCGQL